MNKRQIQEAILGAIGAALISLVIKNYENLVPYRWVNFTTPDGQVSLKFPGKPVAEDQQRTDAHGTPITVHIVAFQSPGGYYGFTSSDVSGVPAESATEALNKARDGAIRNVQGTLIAETGRTIAGYPARDIEAHARKNMFLDARLIVAGTRLYVLMVASEIESNRDKKNIAKFFDSFKVIGK